MEFYRSSAVGIALTKALNEMLQNEDITMEDALKVLSEFDQSFVENFRNNLHIRKDMELMEVKVKFRIAYTTCSEIYSNLFRSFTY